MIVKLTRTPEAAARDDSLAHSTEIHLAVRHPDGTPALMTRDYMNQLRADEWVGLDQIPTECIVGETL